MKVQIHRCSQPGSWWESHVGKVIDVIAVDSYGYWTRDTGPMRHTQWVACEDATPVDYACAADNAPSELPSVSVPPSTIAQQFPQLLSALAATAHANSRAKGFWQVHDVIKAHPTHSKELLTLWDLSRHDLMHSEISEATEGVRKNLPDDHLPHRSMRVCELADAVIRILDVAGAENMPLGEVILEKMAYNAKREFMHGKSA